MRKRRVLCSFGAFFLSCRSACQAITEIFISLHQPATFGRDPQSSVAPDVDTQEPAAHQLPDHGLPFLALATCTNPERGAVMVAVGQYLLGLVATQYVHDMRRAEHLPGKLYRCQNLLCIFGAVDHRNRIEADIAIAARPRLLAEIGQ